MKPHHLHDHPHWCSTDSVWRGLSFDQRHFVAHWNPTLVQGIDKQLNTRLLPGNGEHLPDRPARLQYLSLYVSLSISLSALAKSHQRGTRVGHSVICCCVESLLSDGDVVWKTSHFRVASAAPTVASLIHAFMWHIPLVRNARRLSNVVVGSLAYFACQNPAAGVGRTMFRVWLSVSLSRWIVKECQLFMRLINFPSSKHRRYTCTFILI